VDRQGRFAIQVAALSERENAGALQRELTAAGLPAYIVPPRDSEPAPYRVRVGPFATRSAANTAVTALEKARGEKLWIVKEEPR
jgi:DedD protein